MAERRMFAKSVITSTRFLRMPTSARLLYYDLGMRADDDGVVEAYGVMRETGAREDDLDILVTKGFITVLDLEEWIIYINHWKANNQLRGDRYNKGLHHDLLVSLLPEAEVTFKKKVENDDENAGIPLVDQVATSGIHSKGKVSKGKNKNKAPEGAVELFNSLNLTCDEAKANEVAAAIDGFCRMRKSKRQPLTAGRAVTLIVNKLLTISGGDPDIMIALLDQSTERSWVSIFPLKADAGGNPNLGQPAPAPAPAGGGRRMKPA